MIKRLSYTDGQHWEKLENKINAIVDHINRQHNDMIDHETCNIFSELSSAFKDSEHDWPACEYFAVIKRNLKRIISNIKKEQ